MRTCILLSLFFSFSTGLTHDEIIRNIFSKYICNVQTQDDRSAPEDFKNRSRDRFDVYKYTYNHNGSLMLAGGLMVTKRHGDLVALSRIASDYSILTVTPSPNLPSRNNTYLQVTTHRRKCSPSIRSYIAR